MQKASLLSKGPYTDTLFALDDIPTSDKKEATSVAESPFETSCLSGHFMDSRETDYYLQSRRSSGSVESSTSTNKQQQQVTLAQHVTHEMDGNRGYKDPLSSHVFTMNAMNAAMHAATSHWNADLLSPLSNSPPLDRLPPPIHTPVLLESMDTLVQPPRLHQQHAILTPSPSSASPSFPHPYPLYNMPYSTDTLRIFKQPTSSSSSLPSPHLQSTPPTPTLTTTTSHYLSTSAPTHSLQQQPPLSGDVLSEKRRKRRESHNAVERRRRDLINDKIQELATLIPDLSPPHPPPDMTSTTSANNKPNKGLILKRSVDYVRQMNVGIVSLADRTKELETMLEFVCQQHGIDMNELSQHMSYPIGTPVEVIIGGATAAVNANAQQQHEESSNLEGVMEEMGGSVEDM